MNIDKTLTTFCFPEWSRKLSKSLMEQLGEDWLYLVLLGVVMGVFSFAIDIGISKLRFRKFALSIVLLSALRGPICI